VIAKSHAHKLAGSVGRDSVLKVTFPEYSRRRRVLEQPSVCGKLLQNQEPLMA
jgi:hypothetical protein